MNLAVQFYNDVDQSLWPESMNGDWPYRVIELHDGVEAPEGWSIMSIESYNEYIQLNEYKLADYFAKEAIRKFGENAE